VSIEVGDALIRSTTSDHTARPVGDGEGWEVSWLPGRVLDRDRATSAMMLADTAAGGLLVEDSRWPALDTWARELGLSGPEAVVRASTTDEIRERIARAEAAEAAPHLYGVTDPDEKMWIHYEDEAIDFAQLDPAEQDRQLVDEAVYDLNREAADARAEQRQRYEDAASEAVPMTGPVEESVAGEAWSRRVDEAVHGFDAVDPASLDVWMQAHAESSESHLREADLVAAWESRPATAGSGAAWDGLLGEHERSAVPDDVATLDAAAVRD
jgi:hypothetical protein